MNRFKQFVASQSLKKKWAISSATVIFLSFITMSILLFIALKGWLFYQEEQEVQRTMNDLITFFESQGPYFTVQDIQSNSGLMTSIINQNQTVRLLNGDGIEFLRINNSFNFPPLDTIDLPTKGYSLDSLNSSSISAVGRIQLGGFEGYIQLEHPLNTYQAISTYILTTLLLISFCALLLSGWIGYLLATTLLKPLQDLKMTMDDIADHGFKKNLSVSYQAKDEIGELIVVFDSMMKKLKSSFDQQQQFMADASHELRTPIQVVEGHLALLNRWGKNDPLILEESLGISLREIQQMKILMDDMLDLARGEQITEVHCTNIVEHTCEVITELRLIYPDVIFEHLKPKTNALEVNINANAYRQIIRNILINAIRYSLEEVHVSIRYQQSLDHVIIHVQDQGIGIAPEHQSKIFDRFYRIDSARSRNQGGTGLGLSIVKMLVQNAHGSIHVVSEEGKGSTFSILLPTNYG